VVKIRQNVARVLFVGALMTSPLSNAQGIGGGSENWPEVLQSLYQDIHQSHQAIQAQDPNAQLPQELDGWLEGFVNTPFANGGPQQSLQGLSQQLQSNYSSNQLSGKNEALLNNLLGLVQGLSADLTSNIAGNNTGGAQQTVYLNELTKVHDTDQKWINEKGNELATQFKNLDFQGVQNLLQTLANDIKGNRNSQP